jgi:hypothetical protein
LILAIDPGNVQSAYVLIGEDLKPDSFGKEDNETVLEIVNKYDYTHFAIEMVASYGMPVGREVFETCVWIGRFMQAAAEKNIKAQWIYRKKDVCMNLCYTTLAGDANVRQALVDRFAPRQKNYGKGTKDKPGWFYGFAADVWSAYAVGVTYYDKYLIGG